MTGKKTKTSSIKISKRRSSRVEAKGVCNVLVNSAAVTPRWLFAHTKITNIRAIKGYCFFISLASMVREHNNQMIHLANYLNKLVSINSV